MVVTYQCNAHKGVVRHTSCEADCTDHKPGIFCASQDHWCSQTFRPVHKDVVGACSGEWREGDVGCERQHVVEDAEEHNGNGAVGAVRLVHHAAYGSAEHGHWKVTSRRKETGMVRTDVEDWRAS